MAPQAARMVGWSAVAGLTALNAAAESARGPRPAARLNLTLHFLGAVQRQRLPTREAAIGSVDRGALEPLMAHGLTPEKEFGLIVNGLLR